MAFVLAAAGCGGRGVEQVKVSGRITMNGGPMPGPGTLFFTPVAAAGDAPLRPGSASFGPDGQYSAGAFAAGDGLIPGTYNVGVHCWEVAPSMDGTASKSFLPAKYMAAATSGLQLTVEPGAGSMTKDFAIVSE